MFIRKEMEFKMNASFDIETLNYFSDHNWISNPNGTVMSWN